MSTTSLRSSLFVALSLFVLFSGVALAAPAAETLVVKAGDGAYKPGAATSWTEVPGGVQFKLAAGVDGATVQNVIKERLAGVDVKVEADTLTVSGVPLAALLEQLSGMSLAGDDPLAGLANMGGSQVAMGTPEAGGSIRASKPTALFAQVAGGHDAAERFEAEVLDVARGEYPKTTLKLRVRRPAKAGPLGKRLTLGKVFEAQVSFTGARGADFFTQPDNLRNCAAYHLLKGDRIQAHAVADGEALLVDWVERKAN